MSLVCVYVGLWGFGEMFIKIGIYIGAQLHIQISQFSLPIDNHYHQ